MTQVLVMNLCFIHSLPHIFTNFTQEALRTFKQENTGCLHDMFRVNAVSYEMRWNKIIRPAVKLTVYDVSRFGGLDCEMVLQKNFQKYVIYIGTGCRVQVFSLILDSSVCLSASIQSAGDLVSGVPGSNPAFSRGTQLVSFRFEYRLPVPEHRN